MVDAAESLTNKIGGQARNLSSIVSQPMAWSEGQHVPLVTRLGYYQPDSASPRPGLIVSMYS